MTSIHTNTGAISALQTLRSINANMTQTQNQVSSGLRVGTASDNAAYWSIATTMRSDTKAISAVADSIGLAQAVVDTAYTGMSSILEHLTAIKALMVQAADQMTTGGIIGNVAKIDSEVKIHTQAIVDIANASSFSGLNLLIGEPDQDVEVDGYSFVTGYDRGSIQTTRINLADTAVFSRDPDPYSSNGLVGQTVQYSFPPNGASAYWVPLLNQHIAGYNGEPIAVEEASIFNGIELIIGSMNLSEEDRRSTYRSAAEEFDRVIIASFVNGMSAVGAVSSSLERSAELIKKKIDTNTIGIGRLVDADMNEASTRLKALQTQEQLGIQALSIANSSSDNILSLFR